MSTMSNVAVGETLGLSDAMVSRIRSGARLPSIDTMRKIEQAFGWTVQEQVDCRALGSYASTFNEKIQEAYNA